MLVDASESISILYKEILSSGGGEYEKKKDAVLEFNDCDDSFFCDGGGYRLFANEF